MIVRNEERIIQRCLESVISHIACWVICDTGSIDRTPTLIKELFQSRGIPGELHRTEFIDFEQARNEALARARASALPFDYILLTDADMEFEVINEDFRSRLVAPSYTVLQRSSYSYWNLRLLRREVPARYVGATHEFLSVEADSERLQGVRFIDHAEGSSRPAKYARDIELLERELARRPDDARSWFYLAQSFRESGRLPEAVDAYRRRIALDGWEEEVWYARLQLSRCLLRLDDLGGFLRESLAAWSTRPHRAEPLYDLARYHRLRGENAPAVLFSLAGLNLPWPKDDSLFVEDWIYSHGLAEEFSIAGYYVLEHRDHAARVCDGLSLRRSAPAQVRTLARRNLRYYAPKLASRLPSFESHPIAFPAPPGFHPTNPSVVLWKGETLILLRTVNYHLTPSGHYVTNDGGPVRTRNFLLRLTRSREVEGFSEVLLPTDMPAPLNAGVLGFEDVRPFIWEDRLWATATVRQLNTNGWCETVLARIETLGLATDRFVDWRVIHSNAPRQHEKNWIPVTSKSGMHFIYSLDPTRVINADGEMVGNRRSAWAAEHLSGGSQAIGFGLGWLAVCHEHIAVDQARTYFHRFVWFDRAGVLRRVSRAFKLVGADVEFAAGLAWDTDKKHILISFGVGDGQAWLARFPASEIPNLLDLPDGV